MARRAVLRAALSRRSKLWTPMGRGRVSMCQWVHTQMRVRRRRPPASGSVLDAHPLDSRSWGCAWGGRAIRSVLSTTAWVALTITPLSLPRRSSGVPTGQSVARGRGRRHAACPRRLRCRRCRRCHRLRCRHQQHRPRHQPRHPHRPLFHQWCRSHPHHPHRAHPSTALLTSPASQIRQCFASSSTAPRHLTQPSAP